MNVPVNDGAREGYVLSAQADEVLLDAPHLDAEVAGALALSGREGARLFHGRQEHSLGGGAAEILAHAVGLARQVAQQSQTARVGASGFDGRSHEHYVAGRPLLRP